MKLDHFAKDKDHIHICPFCSEKLLNTYKSVKYSLSCVKCVIPDVKGNDDNPYSKYHFYILDCILFHVFIFQFIMIFF